MAWNSLRDFFRIQRAAQTVLGVYLKRTCSSDTAASSALAVVKVPWDARDGVPVPLISGKYT